VSNTNFQIFKAGLPVTSMEGAVVQFSDTDLQGIAARYDPKLHEAPLIVGHPQHDAPAYGWVRGLSFTDGALAVDEHQVDPAFAELRQQGRYKKVSARFYTPTSKNNPTPGEYYLRDVGFLGAMAPAVKGLRPASFADDAGDLVTAEVSFADLPAYAGGYIGSMFRGLRDFFIEKFGKEEADKVLPDWQVQSLNDISVRAEATDSGIGFADATRSPQASKEKPTMKTTEQLQAEVDAATRERDAHKTRADALEKADRERATAALNQENVSFADALVASSRWPAGAKDVLVATLNHLATPAADKVVSFGDGDAAKPLHQVLREQLQALPEQVSFGEFAGKGSGGGTDDDPGAVAARAVAYQADQATKGNHITTAEAVRQVSKR
jgi:hypothetical protein